MRKPLKFTHRELKDLVLRNVFERLSEFFIGHPLAGKNWEHIEAEFTTAVTKEPLAHTLGGTPNAAFLTFITGPGSVTFDYDDFDRQFVRVTTTGAVKIKFMAGSQVRERA